MLPRESLVISDMYVILSTDEGVYVNSTGGQIKDIRLQWGEVPSSIGKILEHTPCLVSLAQCRNYRAGTN